MLFRLPNLPTGQQQNVVMQPTLDGALAAIFGGASPSAAGPPVAGRPSPAVARLIVQADAQYAAAQAALRAGNLSEFGRLISALGRTLSQLHGLR